MHFFKHYFILTAILITCLPSLYGQNITFNEPLKVIATERVSPEIKKDAELLVIGLSTVENEGFLEVQVLAKDKNNSSITFESTKIKKFICNDIETRYKIWTKGLLFNGTLTNLLLKGYQYDIRNELNNEAIEYINTLSIYNRFYEDEYLEDYLYVLANKIHEGILQDKRPGNIFLKIIKDTEPNAFTLPNGCIIISTGLLSTIQSEDELLGILSHEVAHFVLDHHILNFNQTIDRKKRTEFWANFAKVVASGTDAYLAVNAENYIPGTLTATASFMTSVVSEEVNQRFGTIYSQQQELEADNIAKEILNLLKYNKTGLSVALYRIKNYCISTGNYLALSSTGSHPSLDFRINALGIPDSFEYFVQPAFLKKVSFINSYNAWIELEYYAHYITANELVNRNINNGVAIEDDYIIKAKVKRRLSNTVASNEEVIELLHIAKALNVNPPIILYKEEAISLLRLNKTIEAKKSLDNYLSCLINLKERKAHLQTTSYNDLLENEINWTKKMIFKITKL